MLENWSISALSLWFHLLHCEDPTHIDDTVLELEDDPRNIWFFVSFFKKYIKEQDVDSHPSKLLRTWWSNY